MMAKTLSGLLPLFCSTVALATDFRTKDPLKAFIN
jgi:hypothetical protein